MPSPGSRSRLLLVLLQLTAIALSSTVLAANGDSSSTDDVHHLDLDSRSEFRADEPPPMGFLHRPSDRLRIFCYAGQKPPQLPQLFRTVRLQLRIADGQHFAQYVGATPAAVRAAYEAKRSLFSWTHLLGTAGNAGAGRSEIRLAAFNGTCVGIETEQPFVVKLQVVRVDLVRLAAFVAGVALFVSAQRLTRMPFFYYSSGVGLGVTLSVFLVVWFAARLLPKKSMMLGTVVGGWALLWYFMQAAWDRALAFCAGHQIYVFYYICAAAAISFIACYRIGPPTNQRSLDIVRWSLQLAAAAAIYASSEWSEATVASLIALTCWYYLPWHWLLNITGPVKRFWQRRFPPRRRLLTADEYEEQTRETTRRELARMMEFASSPAARPWQTVAKLKDPKRFAEFVERGVHVTDEEQFDHTQSILEQSLAEAETTSDEEGGGEVSRDVVDTSAERRRRMLGNQSQQQQRRSNGGGAIMPRSSTMAEISDDDDDEEEEGGGQSGAGRRENREAHLTDISDDEE